MQKDAQDVLHPVAFDGRKLNTAELNYPVHEKELLGVRYALQVWRQYININRHCRHGSRKFEIPAVCRLPRSRPNAWRDVLAALGYPPPFLAALNDEPEEIPYLPDYLVSGYLPLVIPGHTLERVRREASAYRVDDNNTLFRIVGDTRLAPYVEPIYRGFLMSKLHTGQSQLGASGLWGLLKSRGWWPSMKSDLRRFCASCGVCQVSSRPQPNQEREYAVVVADTAIQPFERWGVDLIGKLPSTRDGSRWIVTAVDYATGWPLARALPDAKAKRIAEFIHDEIFLNFGAPRD
ncbi:hypothetical protein A4X09_0g7894, partial [Tilletia walkeri]